MDSTPKHVDLPYTQAMVEERLDKTERECWEILNSEPPKPKPEKKDEEKKEDDKKDDDMKGDEKKDDDGQPAASAAGAD